MTVRKAVSGRGEVFSGGLIRLSAENRTRVIRGVSTGVLQPRSRKQWTQAPSKELAGLLNAMRLDTNTVAGIRETTRLVTFPNTAMYFLTCLPEETLPANMRKKWVVPEVVYWPWIGLYNSHLFHAYWLMVGDAFHVNKSDFESVAPPPGWKDSSIRAETERIARKLFEDKVLSECFEPRKGNQPSNYKFHKEGSQGPNIISKLDKILLDAYGLPHDPLLDQMKIVRTRGAQDLS